jgi:hypothetical protein
MGKREKSTTKKSFGKTTEHGTLVNSLSIKLVLKGGCDK